MVKKSSKGKEKKLARKAATDRAAALAVQLRQLVEGSACGATLAAAYPAFQRYERKGLAAALHFYASGEMPPGLLDWSLGLTRSHMAALYDACPGWGWSDAKKRSELAHPDARYLIVYEQQQVQQAQQDGSTSEGSTGAAAAAAQGAGSGSAAEAAEAATEPETEAAQAAGSGSAAGRAAAAAAPAGQENSAAAGNGGGQQQQLAAEAGQGQPVAFVHYRFEEEAGEAVLYCYEIQVAQAVQGKGLGKFLMQLLELVGRRSGVARLMLTVFHQNAAAVALYRRLGYVLDEDSPGTADPSGDHKYEIMTKWLRPQQQQQ